MKRIEKLKELRALAPEELSKKRASLEHELLNLRFRHRSGQLNQTAQLSNLRRDIARINYVIRELGRSELEQPAA